MTNGAARPLRIVFVSGHDPLNVRAFSGTVYYMCQALQAHYPEMELVRFWRPRSYDRFRATVLRATAGRVNPDYWRWLNRIFARTLARRWKGERVLVVCVASAALVSELADWVPVLNITDATFVLMRDFYADFARYGTRTARAAEEIERRSITLAVHNSFSTDWAAQSAVAHYGATRDKVSAISWGCNLPRVARSEIRSRPVEWTECRLLFLGVDWIRKGGDVVLEAGKILATLKVPFQIDIVGTSSPDGMSDEPWLSEHGFLSKSNNSERMRLDRLMRDADFLFLPTRQDTFGMVFGEANAYGTPAITRDVGGVAGAVRDGLNGIVLPANAEPADFAFEVVKLWRDVERYWLLRMSARQEYEERLNWTSWAQSIAKVLDRLKDEGHI